MTDRVLIIDDNLSFLQGLIRTLELSGFDVWTAADGAAGVDLARKYHPDIILCDIMMSGLDGFGVMKALKQNTGTGTIPVVFLTAKTHPADVASGYSLGADDYIKKPCDLNETVYRIRAILKRTQKNETEVKTYGQLHLNTRKQVVFIEGREVHLTPTETLLLNELMCHPNEILSSTDLASVILGSDQTNNARGIVSTHIYNLRHKRLKLESTRATYIVTEGHRGYRLFSEETGLELTPKVDPFVKAHPK